MTLDLEYSGDLYLSGKRPRYATEFMDEAVLQLEAGRLDVAGLLVEMVRAQCEVNRDWAFRNKAGRG
jgi:hypothetical protein